MKFHRVLKRYTNQGGILHMAYQPKSYKKFVATAATATLVATALVPVASAASFSDVSSNYKVAVDYLVTNEIAQGTSDTTFGTTASITRGDAAVMIANALDLNTATAPDAGFKDLNTRVAGAVNALAAAKIIGGKSATSFAPDDKITRQEMAKVVALAYDLDNAGTNNDFVDVNSNWDTYVNSLVKHEVTLGKTATLFGSTQNVTRGEFALFVYRSETLVPATPEVVSVSAINAKELQFVFNRAIDKATVIDGSDDLIADVIYLNSTDARNLTDNAYLSADGKTLTLVASATWNGSYAAEVVDEKIETPDGKKVAEYKAFVSVNDTTRPSSTGVSYLPSGLAKFSFSEPLDETAVSVASKLVVSGPTSVAITDADILVSADNKSFTVVLPSTMTKDASYTFTFTGLKDFAGNLSSPNPISTTVVKADRDTVKPTVSSVVALDTGKLQVTFSEKIQANTAVVTVGGADSSTYTLDATGTIATFTSVTNLTAGVQSVTVKSALDLAGLELVAVSHVIQVSADTTAPAYINHTVETVGADRFLVVNYNEEITANQAVSITGTYVDSNSITQTITPITGADISRGTDKKSVRVKLPVTAGTYTVNLPVALAEDTSAATNDSASRSVSFVVGAPVDTTKPVLAGYVQSGNKVTVTFDRDVTAATALNVGNYSIDGVSSPFASAIFLGNARTVELTLKNDVITTNGVRNYTVSNVATSAGSVMVTKTDTYDFKENVRPTVQSAKVISSTEIEVTLSEALAGATVGTDFDVFQGSSTTALVDSEAISGTNKVIITLGTPLESLIGLTLKSSSTINLTDTNGNAVNFVGPIAITN